MGAGLNALMDRRKLAFASAKFRAWWDGAEFDEEAVRAALEAVVEPVASADAGAAPAIEGADDALFDSEPDPRLQALQLIWGEGRLAPATDEAELRAKLALPEDGAVAVLGPGLAKPVEALGLGGRAQIYEWRAEALEALRVGLTASGLPAESAAPFDLDVTSLPQDAFVGLISFDELTYAGHAPRLALQAARAVKAGCAVAMESYVGPSGPDLAHAFASAFAEPQVRLRSEIEQALSEAGFDIVAEEDLTEAHIAVARAAFEALPERMSGEGAPKLAAGAAREIAWETETWRVRLRMLLRRRLERRRFVLRRRG